MYVCVQRTQPDKERGCRRQREGTACAHTREFLPYFLLHRSHAFVLQLFHPVVKLTLHHDGSVHNSLVLVGEMKMHSQIYGQV